MHAIRVIDRANSAGLPLHPQDFFGRPTVSELARVIESRLSERRCFDTLVSLQPRGKLQPVIFFHSIPGDLLGYGSLVHRMGGKRPCYGLQSLGLSDPSLAHSSIEEMASYYADRLVTEFPETSLHLVGWCFGGHVALETYRALAERGHQPASLAMLEGMPVVRPWQRIAERLKTLSEYSLGQLARLGTARIRGEHKEDFEEDAQFALEARSGVFANRLAVYDANQKALHGYRTRKIDVHLLLVRAQDRPGTLASENYGWPPFVTKLSVVRIDGSHESLVREPAVKELTGTMLDWFLLHDS